MPANRLTADCIWSSFRNSGKKHLFLTGSRGSGKTTLLNELFPENLPGITTWAEPKKAVYLQENITGKTVQVGIYDDAISSEGNRMTLLHDGFNILGEPVLVRCMESESIWITIDEIGYLESQSESYHTTMRQLLDKKQVAAVIRKQNLPFLNELRSRDDVFLVDLDNPFGLIGCVIMASGLGKRFGGNKLMADFEGAPMICRVLDATEGIFSKRIVVTRHQDVAQLCEARGVETLLHDLPNRNDTVRLGLEAMVDMERCLFAVADQPLLRWESVAGLALASVNAPDSIWRLSFADIPGSPVIFPSWAFSELKTLPEGKGGDIVIKKYPERVRTVTVRDVNELKDVDSPKDLEALIKR